VHAFRHPSLWDANEVSSHVFLNSTLSTFGLMANFFRVRGGEGLSAEDIARRLLHENALSVRLWHGDRADAMFPELATCEQTFVFEPAIWRAIDLLGELHRYRYNACHHPSWDRGFSHRLSRRLGRWLAIAADVEALEAGQDLSHAATLRCLSRMGWIEWRVSETPPYREEGQRDLFRPTTPVSA
jgi:hypothetical protein